MFDPDDYRPARRIPVRAVDDAIRAVMPSGRDGASPAPRPAKPPEPEPVEPEAATDWKDMALRQQAEMANFRKRQERRADEAILAERERLLRRILPVLDNLERALNVNGAGDGRASLAEGIELTRRELARLLEGEGVTAVPGTGEAFNPEVHEAMATVHEPARAGTVVEVLEAGYTMNGRLLRPARVVVAA